jgi:DNA-binding XRE family transcriptional regulator
MKTYKEFKAILFKDKKVKAEYLKNKPEYDLISQLIEKRLKIGMTQSDVAKILGTKQTAISRLESGEHSTSINRYVQYAGAVDSKLRISLE